MRVLDFLDPDQRAVVEPLLETRELGSGENLYAIGEPADCSYLVVSGMISVRQLNGFGMPGQAVALLSSGAPAGEAALVGVNRRNSTLTAVEDSMVLRLSLEHFSQLRKEHPDIGVALLEFFLLKTSVRLQRCSARLSEIL
jgi:CRP-like cAMP-binding protein